MEITVFTPAYNRAYIIGKLYESLLSQTDRNFEWLIVDDGSTDGTEALCKSFIAEQKIPVYYIKTENGGKHRAINRGVKAARGDFFFIVDSDDYLPGNAIERVRFYTEQIKDDCAFAGVCGLRVYTDGRKVGGEADYQVLDTDAISIREKYHVKGDLAEIYKTEVMRQYPFPEFENEKFVSEELVWNRIARKYKLRYFYEGIYVCDYLADGLTKSIRRHFRNSPKGTMNLYHEQFISDRRWKTKIIAAINYWRYTINYKGKRKGKFAPVWWSYLFYLPGVLFYGLDIYKEK